MSLGGIIFNSALDSKVASHTSMLDWMYQLGSHIFYDCMDSCSLRISLLGQNWTAQITKWIDWWQKKYCPFRWYKVQALSPVNRSLGSRIGKSSAWVLQELLPDRVDIMGLNATSYAAEEHIGQFYFSGLPCTRICLLYLGAWEFHKSSVAHCPSCASKIWEVTTYEICPSFYAPY